MRKEKKGREGRIGKEKVGKEKGREGEK